ncbi:MAG TPA: cofactor-independent phosphoglycerate mutase [Syntrophales bacterium]|nr:cofactor-independent phosphoglycerate mutase [Syntrophales bacterium]
MKYLILLGDGMADFPIAELGGKTPLEYARTPNMDWMASHGTVGRIDTIPHGFKPGSDVATLSVLGYNPAESYSGRGPLEAANMGVQMAPQDVAFRCNLVTIAEADGRSVMDDFTAGHIPSDESRRIIEDIHRELGNEEFQFYPGVGYRHLCVWRGGSEDVLTTPPHDISGKAIDPYLPQGAAAAPLLRLMELSRDFLARHPVNRRRTDAGRKAANSIWLWGQGRAPAFERLTERYRLDGGGVISAVDLLNGIGVYAGLEVIRVEGATGYTDTNYAGKAQKALEHLDRLSFIFLHVEAPDEMGHEGNLRGKIKAIEDFDEQVVGTVLKGVKSHPEYRIMVLSDHPTPISIKTHSADPSPFAVFSSKSGENLRNAAAFGESQARQAGILVSPGHRLLGMFLGDWRGRIEKELH